MARIARRLFQSCTLVGVALLRTVAAGYGSLPAGSLFQDQLLVDLDDQIRTGVSSIQARSSSYGGGIGGCSDAFSVFGFLAFLLALLDLIMDLQGNANAGGGGGDGGGGDGGRRRRELPPGCAAEPELVEASLASYAMLRAFVNALHTDDEQCGQRFLCEGASEAAGLGEVGRVVARVASHNAAGWLRQRAVSSGWPLTAAITFTPAGTPAGTCHQRYNCSRLPDEYRYPNSGGAGPPIDVNYRPVLQFVSETVRRYL